MNNNTSIVLPVNVLDFKSMLKTGVEYYINNTVQNEEKLQTVFNKMNLSIELPKNVHQFKTTLKLYIEYMQGNRVKNNNKLNEALAKSFGLKNYNVLNALLKTTKVNNAYIEEISVEELKTLILSNEDFQFKHKDCALFFFSDGDNLYASDMDDKEMDCFQNGNFVDTIKSHYQSLEPVIALLYSLKSVGLDLLLSDFYHNHEMNAENFIKFAE